MRESNYISTQEAAEILGVSRVAILKKIKKGQIEAEKVGRNFIVDKRSLGSIYQEMSHTDKELVREAVDRVVSEYGAALKRLGKE